METEELERILAKGWSVQLRKQSETLWDVTVAVTSHQLALGNHISEWGASNLSEALKHCEKGIIQRWDELHPQLEKGIFGYEEIQDD